MRTPESPLQIIPTDQAVHCENCGCISNSVGHRCEVCDSPSLVSVQAMMEQDYRRKCRDTARMLVGIDK